MTICDVNGVVIIDFTKRHSVLLLSSLEAPQQSCVGCCVWTAIDRRSSQRFTLSCVWLNDIKMGTNTNIYNLGHIGLLMIRLSAPSVWNIHPLTEAAATGLYGWSVSGESLRRTGIPGSLNMFHGDGRAEINKFISFLTCWYFAVLRSAAFCESPCVLSTSVLQHYTSVWTVVPKGWKPT